jgi:hypothetical protein
MSTEKSGRTNANLPTGKWCCLSRLWSVLLQGRLSELKRAIRDYLGAWPPCPARVRRRRLVCKVNARCLPAPGRVVNYDSTGSIVLACGRSRRGSDNRGVVNVVHEHAADLRSTAHALDRWNGRLTEEQAIGVAILKFG